jgi:voltage-gated potassium channel
MRYATAFVLIEYVSLLVFTVEYGLRLWCAIEHGPHQHLRHSRARMKYALSTAGIIDLIAVLPFWFAMLLPSDLRFVLVFRMVRFFKIARYSPAMRSLLDVLYSERRGLVGCLIIALGTALVAASLMHLAEGKIQPDKLGTIPDAFWWAIVTIGTIGYGDVVPVTALGKLIATVTIFAGLVLMALPVGIIATAFAEQIQRRDFIVTWGMISRVPLFTELDAAEISDVMELLRAQVAEPGEIIVREGDAAHSMYFHCRRGSRNRPEEQERAPSPRRRAVLRGGGGAAPLAAVGNCNCAHPDQPVGTRRPRSARADAARSAHRRTHRGCGREARGPRGDLSQGRYCFGGDKVNGP